MKLLQLMHLPQPSLCLHKFWLEMIGNRLIGKHLLHGIISQKTVLFILNAVKTSNLILLVPFEIIIAYILILPLILLHLLSFKHKYLIKISRWKLSYFPSDYSDKLTHIWFLHYITQSFLAVTLAKVPLGHLWIYLVRKVCEVVTLTSAVSWRVENPLRAAAWRTDTVKLHGNRLQPSELQCVLITKCACAEVTPANSPHPILKIHIECRIGGSHIGGYEECNLLGYNAM
jgi:hypothetical protein